MAKNRFIKWLIKTRKNHPIIFWGVILLYIVIPDPIPVVDDIIVAMMGIFIESEVRK